MPTTNKTDSSSPKNHRARAVRGIAGYKRKPAIEENKVKSREQKIRFTILTVILTIATLFLIDKTFWMFIKDAKEKKKQELLDEEKFKMNRDKAKEIVAEFLNSGDASLVKNGTSKAAIALYERKFTQNNPSITKVSKLNENVYPNHFKVFTTIGEEIPFIVLNDNERHAIDLEATIGYNTVPVESFLNMKTEAENYVRITLHDRIQYYNQIYGAVTASLPNQSEIITLYYEKNTPVGHYIDSFSSLEENAKYTVYIRLLESLGEPQYFISTIHEGSWVYKIVNDPDMESFKSLDY